MSKELIDGFLADFDDGAYPRDFLKRFEPNECMAHTEYCETLLVWDKQDGLYRIAKCYLDSSLSGKNESDILERLRHPGLPAFIAWYQQGGMLCVVREYAEGVPLDVWRRERGRSEPEIVAIAVQLCDILTYLHGQDPPVIHRDIKPQNIVVDSSGRVKLIDFGIARTYDATARADTVCFGTQEFAPPEQYGFAQTDCRADVFSLGIVLLFLLTGQTDMGEAAGMIRNRQLAKIVARCAAFSPAGRYADAGRVRRALLSAVGTARKKAAAVLGVALASALLLAAGFSVGRYTDVLKDAPAAMAARFKEPLIERAVRQALGRGEGEKLTAADIAGVTELYIWGESIATDIDGFYRLGQQWRPGNTAGSIVSLSDLSMLPNLRVLMVADQKIEDISPVAGLKQLTSLDIDKDPVRDISAVSALPKLELIGLNETEVSDLSPLAACHTLKKLVLNTIPAEDFSFLSSLGDIEYLHIINIKPEKVLPYLAGKSVRQLSLGYAILPSVTDLKGIKNLQELYMDEVYLNDLTGIDALGYLTHLRLVKMAVTDLSPLLTLPYLKQVDVDKGMSAAAEAIAGKAKFTISYQ